MAGGTIGSCPPPLVPMCRYIHYIYNFTSCYFFRICSCTLTYILTRIPTHALTHSHTHYSILYSQFPISNSHFPPYHSIPFLPFFPFLSNPRRGQKQYYRRIPPSQLKPASELIESPTHHIPLLPIGRPFGDREPVASLLQPSHFHYPNLSNLI